MNKKKSFTLVELIIVIVITGILAGSGLGAIIRFSSEIFLIPQDNLDLILHQISQTIIEGSLPESRLGLRYGKELSIMEQDRVSFRNQSGQSIEFKIEEGKLKKSVAGGDFEKVPRYLGEEVVISGVDGIVFQYWDKKGEITDNPVEVRRIDISLEAKKGNRSSQTHTGVAFNFFAFIGPFPEYPLWNPEVIYQGGQRVFYDGVLFEARHWPQHVIQGEEPGVSGWQEITERWRDFNFYRPGDIVWHNNKKYFARFINFNSEPGLSTDWWLLDD